MLHQLKSLYPTVEGFSRPVDGTALSFGDIILPVGDIGLIVPWVEMWHVSVIQYLYLFNSIQFKNFI